MADDWQVGDLALCVRGGPRDFMGNGFAYENSADYCLVPGRIYVVRRIDTVKGFVGLAFEGLVFAWLSSRFRKIRPHAPDAEDAETIRLMRGKPARVEA